MRRELTYATVCSGIECMSAAAIGLPLRPVFFSEIEPFPCAVLKHRFPNVPNLGDMSRITVNEKGEITNGRTTVALPAGGLDVLAGGTPCTDVSYAGKRRGMQEGSGTRSSLAFEFVRLIRELKPRYVVWENVAGVLSDQSFPGFLRAIADRGYGVAYRTLDAQFVRCADIDLPDGGVVRLERAVPQRRRRVWAVGCAGEDLRRASDVLFEPQGVCGDRPPRRRTWQGPSEAARGRARLPDGVVGRASGFDPYEPGGVKTLNNGHAGTLINGSCPGCHNAVCYENHQTDARTMVSDVAPTMGASRNAQAANNNPLVVETLVGGRASFGINANGVTKKAQMPFREECADTLAAGHQGGVVIGLDRASYNQSDKAKVAPVILEGLSPTIIARGPCALAFGQGIAKREGGGDRFSDMSSTLRADMRYIVRRLTPTECERLMGLPDGWTLPAFAPGEITDALVAEFVEIFGTFGAVMAGYAGKRPPKPKTAAWVRKWLERISDPETCPDAPRYKACGNGMCTNQVRWIFLRLLHAEDVNPWYPEP